MGMLDERRQPREVLVAAVMIADQPELRSLPAADERVDMPVGVGIVAILDQVAGDQQQLRPRRPLIELVDDEIQPAHIQLVRVVAVEADVKIGDLGDQHGFVARQ